MNHTELIAKKIAEVLERAGIEAAVEEGGRPEDVSSYFNVVTPDGRLLIGSRAENLFAFEYLIKRLVEKETGELGVKFLVDINGYRLHRLEELKEEVKRVAKKVRLYRKEIVLKPMSPFERRTVHTVLSEYPDITTESIGEGEGRRVVIKPYP
ncbi:MAG: hypothetical protein HYW90_02345 [Candidatus Sungbacteria bacterium]|nr:hypothetical protein [Candidatus Sungbacteria bacterium]